MADGSFSEYVDGFTSDHTYQTATAVSYAKDGTSLSLSGMTWNLLNKAHSKTGEHTHTNNPFDVDEHDQSYTLRKGNQLRFLWHQIKSDTLDFIALQEVDLFTHDPLPAYVKDFLEKIRAKGWFTVHSDKSDDVRIPLITLYNTKKLRFISKRSILPMAVGGRKCGLEATFAYLGSTAEVCITNVHLDFDTDHRTAILEYQQQQIAAGKFTVIAGDANYSPDREHYSLVGDLDMPTNISRPIGEQVSADDGGRHLWRLDGFMAGPANANARVEITEGPGAYFKWIPANLLVKTIKGGGKQGKYACRTYDPKRDHTGHMTHISLPGLPWIRDKYKHLLVGQA
ncbi:MAG TPA: hypothetical protein VLG38_06715 [Gammaproteobacteria bacterium]|nr:hypothetical protein [Gammaproteobacteria bacterium]